MLLILNVPLIGFWVKLLQVTYRYLSLGNFLHCGRHVHHQSQSHPGLVSAGGIAGAIFTSFDFSAAPILLGFVLGSLVEENFRRALLLSLGSLSVFVERPISAAVVTASALLVFIQVVIWIKAI